MSTTYAIDNGRGERLTAGLQEHEAEQVAQRMADERGEPVYLYEMIGEGDEQESEYVEFEPHAS